MQVFCIAAQAHPAEGAVAVIEYRPHDVLDIGGEDEAVLGVDAHRHLAGKGLRGGLHEVRIAHRRRADDDARHTLGQPAFDGPHVADAAAELDREGGRRADRLDGRCIHRLAGEGAVEIDDVEIVEALRLEGLRLRCGVVGVDGGLCHVALAKAHAAAFLEVDRGKEPHGRHSRKLPMSVRPRRWLFSGWNCVPTMVSRAIIAVTLVP